MEVQTLNITSHHKISTQSTKARGDDSLTHEKNKNIGATSCTRSRHRPYTVPRRRLKAKACGQKPCLSELILDIVFSTTDRWLLLKAGGMLRDTAGERTGKLLCFWTHAGIHKGVSSGGSVGGFPHFRVHLCTYCICEWYFCKCFLICWLHYFPLNRNNAHAGMHVPYLQCLKYMFIYIIKTIKKLISKSNWVYTQG